MENLVRSHAGNSPLPDPAWWAGRRVLLTGQTGFKGAWLAIWLRLLGANVTSIALPPSTVPNLFDLAGIEGLLSNHYCDIRDRQTLGRLISAAQPEVVLHLAAQSLVRTSYRQPLETMATNIMGTANLLDALREICCARVALMVTTDKVYQNREWAYPYRELDRLGGHDPYSASKAAAELIAASYRDAYLQELGVAVATARAGNVIGGGDWAEDRLLPDAVRAWQADKPLVVRSPNSIRPWQHVLDCLRAYLILAERLWADPTLAGAWNFGPPSNEAATVRELVDCARESYGKGEVTWGTAVAGPHEAGSLALDTSRARSVLGLAQRWSMVESTTRTMTWYRDLAAGIDARSLCEADILAFSGS